MERRVLNGRGPTSFTIHGELRHQTGSLLPEAGNEGTYSQLYIYDPDAALHVRNSENPHLKRVVLKIIQDNLNIIPFPQNTAKHMSSNKDRRRYNLPSADEIGIILHGDGTNISGMRDITKYSTILRTGKLFQEFLVDAWASTEHNRLTYYKLNQGRLRADLYNTLSDFDVDELQFILPSLFTDSPRHMFEIFQDSMAITRYNKHPDIFLTMKANPNWIEITSALRPKDKPLDRLNLIARVFELKRRCLMKEIEKNGVFGLVVAHVFTIEFQKRGLPHMHALLFLQSSDKIQIIDQVDKIVSAEFPNLDDDPILFQTVKSCMVHGPCGARNPQASCMENVTCTKRYPRAFADTMTMEKDGYPIYRRRNTRKMYTVKGKEVDNRDVVPYNAYLSRMFDCHINVEVCVGVRCVKYIHKYIYKSYDQTTFVIGSLDEIQQYLDARYIGPPEAACRIFGHLMHEEHPNVVRLAIHLPGMHQVVFNPSEPAATVLSWAQQQMSTLTVFFKSCTSDPVAQAFTYQEFLQHFVWNNPMKMWTRRQRGYAIGRIYFASPNASERFYLRLLLTVVKGPKSFECLRTVNNALHSTFKSASIACGLLEDDGEWIQCLQEAAIMKTGSQLRSLFSVILMECIPLELDALCNRFSNHLCDDLAYKIRIKFGILDPSESQITDYGLFLLNQLLQESGKSLSNYPPMPLPSGNWTVVVGSRLIWEQRQFQYEAQRVDAQINIDRLNDAQRFAYNTITNPVFENSGKIFFLNVGAGTGKTLLFNTISSKCHSLGHIVLTVASSDIASLLLVGGRTAHSIFHILLDVLENSICGFSKQSLHAKLFRETSLIIWDEVPMQHRYCVEAVDRTLQDIRNDNNPFGGITIVLGGDVRQILPVILGGVREQIVAASLRRSHIWTYIHVLTLTLNMRLQTTELENNDLANFFNEIGTNPQEIVSLPSVIQRCNTLDELLSMVYPQLSILGTISSQFLTERTILFARNDDVTIINAAALNLFPGDSVVHLAADRVLEDEENPHIIRNQYPNEYLNSLDPPGLPPFKLELKVGCPVMLLRNIALKDGFCNGTRLMVVRCGQWVIEARLLTGDKVGDLVFIPRISLTPSSSEMPIQMTRHQFPLRLAYAITIIKSQRQSVKFVGIDLHTPIFVMVIYMLHYPDAQHQTV